MDLVFATNNLNKLTEIQNLVGNQFKILSLSDIDCYDDIPETGDTLSANALQKARYVFERYQINCFADDTGLEVESLDGAPGVYSARYAGPERSAENNMKKVLDELKGSPHRDACFKTVIALIIGGQETLFEGRVDGQLLEQTRGHEGFGYDPIFQPKGYDKTFAEMPLQEKNKISHRSRAVKKLITFLNSEYAK